MGQPAAREAGGGERHEPLNMPLPRGVWRRIIRAVNSKEDTEIHIVFKGGHVVAARAEREIDLED